MKKGVLAPLLAICMTLTLLALPAAAANESGILQVIRATGIMVGDTSGNMNLDHNVTRAQFAKMAVCASTYKDTIGGGGPGYSLFSDVKSSYWASEYIKVAVDQKWMVGYTNGSYRPNNSITLEQACTTALRMLGYDFSTLAGSYPTAQLTKASALGLRKSISLGQGDTMTRRDCMYLFYNLLTAQNSDGQTYATTLGYTVSNNEVSFTSVIEKNLDGPYVCGSTAPVLLFTPTAVYRDGSASSLAAVSQYDVYYYSSSLKMMWVYTNRAIGTVTAISPNTAAPTSVTVGGTSYDLGTTTATYQFSNLGSIAVDDTVMLLLGMDGKVVDVITGADINTAYYGVVQSYSSASSTTGSAAIQTTVNVTCTDGVVHSFTVNGKKTFSTGALVSVNIGSNGTAIQTLTVTSLSGTVNASGTMLGTRTFAANAQILDTASTGNCVKVSTSRLAGCSLPSSSVRYYVLNESGEISHLILNDATGDTWSYGYMLSTDSSTAVGNTSGSYLYLIDGEQGTLFSNGSTYPVTIGGFAVRYNADGSVKNLQSISSGKISQLSSLYAIVDNRQVRMADHVQVYIGSSGAYYATTLSAINTVNYTLTAWYDNFGVAGGRIRVITAVAK